MTSPDPRVPHERELGPLREAAARPPGSKAFPVDHSREAPGIAALHRRGYTAEFVVDGDRLRVTGTDRRLGADELRIRDYYRFEGTSDPDDMAVIYALEARDGTRGTLTDAYGSYADPRIGAIIDRIPVVPFAEHPGWRTALIPAALGALALATAAMIARRRAA